MEDLRAKCPWDRKQTMDSLRSLTIEETYELADAVLEDNMPEVSEEIGDLMLHMVFYAKIAEEEKAFDLAQALNALCEKLIQRHPHIYGDVEAKDEEAVKRNWEEIKLEEGKKSVLSGVPRRLPAVIKAYRMQDKTGQVGFEWDHKDQVWEKVQEELEELRTAMNRAESQERKEEEFGDVLFALINFARYEDIDPEAALERVNMKFKKRFEFIEDRAERPLREMNLDEMDQLWVSAKKYLSKSQKMQE